MFSRRKREDIDFEEVLGDQWACGLGIAEAPLERRSIPIFGAIIVILGIIIIGRVGFLGLADHEFYSARAAANLSQVNKAVAPRGVIEDVNGKILADNKPIFFATLNVKDFLKDEGTQQPTFKLAEEVLGLNSGDLIDSVNNNNQGPAYDSIIIGSELSLEQVIKIKAANLSTLSVTNGFERQYTDGAVFSSVLGYTGVVDSNDLKRYPELTGRDFAGKVGLEVFYERYLRGQPGVTVKISDALGNIKEEREQSKPVIGQTLHLTIDADFQKYFYNRLQQGLTSLGRNVGVGLALNPQTGEVLALVNLPSYDNNIFGQTGKNEEKQALFDSPHQPLFNRAIGGFYNPGSTIKPLVGVAALEEKVIDPQTYIFSPGYMDVPNPYDPSKPTRFLDWRYQGDVNLASALAQSSNVYFYNVGGGSPYAQSSIKGLGITRLNDWWKKFHLGSALGIDLPGEANGFLPTPEDKKKKTGRNWLLGDTYNASIGQGDLLVTPIQLLSYIDSIANGGKIYRPFLVKDFNKPEVVTDLSSTINSILEVRKGMELAVTSPKGTAYLLHDLPFSVAGKTGSAQVKNNAQENAFFVGYAPTESPKIAILVLIENSKEGSLNTVPIAKDVLNWYYQNRVQ